MNAEGKNGQVGEEHLSLDHTIEKKSAGDTKDALDALRQTIQSKETLIDHTLDTQESLQIMSEKQDENNNEHEKILDNLLHDDALANPQMTMHHPVIAKDSLSVHVQQDLYTERNILADQWQNRYPGSAIGTRIQSHARVSDIITHSLDEKDPTWTDKLLQTIMTTMT